MKNSIKMNSIQALLLIVLLMGLIIFTPITGQLLIMIEIIINYLIYFLAKELGYKMKILNRPQDRVEEKELTTKEANRIKFETYGLREPFHSEKVDEAVGADYEAKLIKHEDGTVIFKERTKYGGKSCLASLAAVLFFGFFVIVCITSSHKAIIDKKYEVMIVYLFLIPIELGLCAFYDNLKEDIKEMGFFNQSKEEKEKKNYTIPEISYNVAIFSFILIFVVGFSSKVVPYFLREWFSQLLKIGLIGFFGGIVLYVISSTINFITSKKDKK